ncbi:uncharacterized protein LOC132789982 [Drosophila nasuta]|uniref:uncharacterized protein LOC132789982 n=1 Tax=Drosophila nasuta TaxID=42062 RepID=UPI00295EC2BC|nr:uncharacterized protein LOC132789982 [Drosophila nasuta]
MEKIKQKVIGVLRERDGGTNVNRSSSNGIAVGGGVGGGSAVAVGSHQVGVGVAVAIGVTQDNGNGNDINGGVGGNAPGPERNDAHGHALLNNGSAAAAGGAGIAGAAVGVGGSGVASGAARTSVLSRPQTSKISALDLAGILNTRRRLEWTKEWLRKNQSEFLSKENLLSELQSRKDECYHLNYFLAITESQFRYLVQKLDPIISQYAPQRKKKSFSAEERLAITLKYLATGEVHSCRNYCFRASKFVINEMIANICLGFYEHLKDQYVTLPKTDEQWRNAATDMERKHQLPQCVGNLFMRSIQLQNNVSNNSSSSGGGGGGGGGNNSDERKRAIIFTAIVDADNNFQYVKVERAANSRPNDIYNQTTAVELIEQKMQALGARLEEQSHDLPCGLSYYLAGDAVLPSTSYLVSTRNVSKDSAVYDALEQVNAHAEQTMRILCNIFPILAQPLRVSEKHIGQVVLGCVALYNFLRKTDDSFRRNSDNIVQQRGGIEQPQHAYVDSEDIDDDCIMLATEEELRERAEFTPSVGLTTCFQTLCAQRGDTSDGQAKRDWLLNLPVLGAQQQQHGNSNSNSNSNSIGSSNSNSSSSSSSIGSGSGSGIGMGLVGMVGGGNAATANGGLY